MSDLRLPFQLEATSPDTHARAGRMQTLHGEVLTPVFMPVGTQATVKAQLTQTLEDAGSQVLLANTYHLLLRPGPEVFRKLGGIHHFMSWPRAVLTDSGGFQIFSLPHARSMTEAGAAFQSYIDGRTILLSPELSIETQMAIGSDIMMVLDQCIPSTADKTEARAALGITHRWAARSLAARGDSRQGLFGIVQGALFTDLRRESVEALTAMPFDGFAIGGLAVGESKSEREDVCGFTADLLPADRPRYLMGVGTPLDILEAVHRGVDMFDCIIPTQVAQRGGAFTSRGFLQLRRGVYKMADEALDPGCDCPTCLRYSRAYLHHLTKTKETLGWQLVGRHNFYFYHSMMREIRASIFDGSFTDFYKTRKEILQADDLDNPVRPMRRNPQKSLSLGAYTVHTAREGFSSIVHVESGEIMHSRVAPMDEARSLYVGQSRLKERLESRGPEDPPLVIWDVGLGAAANAMAAIECHENLLRERGPELTPKMQMVSFENDLDSLKLAWKHHDRFPYLRHSGPPALLGKGSWQSKTFPSLEWSLIQGNFPDTAVQAHSLPDLVFYDMFSAKTCGGLWTMETFQHLHDMWVERPVWLFTYTTSTAVRVAMLAAGFFLARGCSTGDKEETTIAMTAGAFAQEAYRVGEVLGEEWLARWRRSSARFPTGCSEAVRDEIEAKILRHPQFSNLKPARNGSAD